jgi:drug/metabolite transporter (DMT)-like permease
VLVTGAVLASAVLHACWNALAHRAGDALAAVALVMVGLAGVSLPLVFFVAAPAAASWPFLAVSLVLHVTYTVLLARCYSIGDFGQVYPLARGSAPLVVALLAVVLVGERLSWVALAGVGAVCGGLWVLVGGAGLRGFGLRGRVHNPRAVLVAAATGLAIAGYTTVDGVGVRRAGSTLGYTVWLLGALGVAMLAYAAWQYGRSLVASMRRLWWLVAVGGALGWASYALVLWAQTRGALAAVAALRETSVVVAAVLGTLFFGERFGRRRIVATLLVAAGIVLLNL